MDVATVASLCMLSLYSAPGLVYEAYPRPILWALALTGESTHMPAWESIVVLNPGEWKARRIYRLRTHIPFNKHDFIYVPVCTGRSLG